MREGVQMSEVWTEIWSVVVGGSVSRQVIRASDKNPQTQWMEGLTRGDAEIPLVESRKQMLSVGTAGISVEEQCKNLFHHKRILSRRYEKKC